MTNARAYVEHVAIWVEDLQWHLRFFERVLGMTLRDVDGPADAPRQCWTYGGIQLIQTTGRTSAGQKKTDGRLAHIGMMCEDLDAALEAAKAFDVSRTAEGPNWLHLPDGLVLELIQAQPADSVSRAVAINPRQEG